MAISDIGEWLTFLSVWAMVPFATIAVFEGVRRVSWRRATWKHAALLIFGMAVLGGEAGVKWRAVSITETGLASLERPLPSIPDATFDKMAPQEREDKTLLRAKITFAQTGALMDYVNASGQRIPYAPSEKEIRDREFERVSVAQIRTLNEGIRTQAWALMIAWIVAAAGGFYVRFHERSERES
jgi:hypothetical protein